MTKLVAIVGSVTPPGRLFAATRSMLDAARIGSTDLDAQLINLADCRVAFADGRPPEQYQDDTASIVERVRGADCVIFASPVYRGSYTGALKNLLDHLPIESLMGKPVGIIAMGATAHHFLGVDWHLRDVLAWFGAFVVPTSVYLMPEHFVEGQPRQSAKQDLTSLAQAVIKMHEVLPAIFSAPGHWPPEAPETLPFRYSTRRQLSRIDGGRVFVRENFAPAPRMKDFRARSRLCWIDHRLRSTIQRPGELTGPGNF